MHTGTSNCSCALCSGLKLDEFREKVRQNVEQHGWHVTAVLGSGDVPTFAYSCGLYQRFGHAEVALVGLPPETAHHLINDIGEMVRKGMRFLPGTAHPNIFRDYEAIFVAVRKESYPQFFNVARWFYQGDEFPVLQVFWPDVQGRFPWEDGADASAQGQFLFV